MKNLREPIERIASIVGTWKGRGLATFPTIQTTEYLDEIKFEFVETDLALFFEQRTWYVKDNNKSTPLHWESGYILCKEEGIYVLSNAQNNGRTEVLSGSLSMFSGNTFHLALNSIAICNDERMLRTSRDIYVDGDALKYYINMATKITPEFQNHLESTLLRVK
jgi:prenyltransferase beta subunit